MVKRTKRGELKKLGVFDKPFFSLSKDKQRIANSINRHSHKQWKKRPSSKINKL